MKYLDSSWQTPAPPAGGVVTFELTNEKGDPVVHELITLRIYGLVAEDRVDERPAGSCLTDAAGQCTLTVRYPDYSDLGVTGFVQVAEESVAFVWPGNDLHLRLSLDANGRLSGPGHAPYEGQDMIAPQPTLLPVSQRPIVYRGPLERTPSFGLWLSLVVIVLGLSVLGWTLWSRRR